MRKSSDVKSTRDNSGFRVGWGGLKAPKRPGSVRLPSAEWNQWIVKPAKLIKPDQNRVFSEER